MEMENLARSTKTIRVSYCDPDATDSSSDEESDKSHGNSRRKVHEIELEFVQKYHTPCSDSGNFEEESGSMKPKPTSEGEKMVGVRMLKTGKFGAEIQDPFNNKRLVWLGTFGTAEAASRAYLAKESKFTAAKLRAKQRLEWASENSPFQDSVPSILDSDNPNSTSTGKKIVGVRMTNRGNFGASIIDPFKKKKVWLGSFTTAEEASRAYLAKDAQFVAKKLRVKEAQFVAKKRAQPRIDPASCSSTFQDSVSSVLGNGTSDLTSFQEGARTRISRVRQRSCGKCCSEIRNPITSSEIRNQTSRARLAEKAQYAAKKSRPKRRIDRVASDKSTFQDSVSSGQDNYTSDLTSFQEGARTRISGFRRRNLGKFCAEIRNPVTKRRLWLGRFGTTEEASRAYLDNDTSFHEGARSRISVRRRNRDKFSAEITNPITKRRVWLGTFATEEEASRAYLAKEDEVSAKQCFGRVTSEKSLAPDSVSSVLEIETSDLSNETGVTVFQEAEFGVFNGVQVVDKNGFLVGEFSMLDDLSICSEEAAYP